MADVDRVTVNGNIFDFGSISCLIDSDAFTGIKTVKYGDKRERTKAYGTSRSRIPRGRTRGKYTCDASLSVYADSAESFRQKLAAKAGGSSWGDAVFDLTLQYFENGSDLVSIKLVKCCCMGDEASHDEGTDPLTEDMPIDPMYIIRNGVTLFSAAAGGIAGLPGLGI